MEYPIMPAPLNKAGFLLPPFAPRCALVLSFVFLFIGLSQAEVGVSINGTVTDSNGIPLPGVHVSVDERQVLAVTDWRGRYQFSGITSGTYNLTATHIGYHPSFRQRVSVHEGSSTRVNFILSTKTEHLPTVTASQPSRVHFSQPGRRLVITRSDWQISNPRTVGDVLQNCPGVIILEGDHLQRISLRGSSPRAVHVYLDGIPLNDAGTGEAEISRIDPDHLEAIEIDFEGIGGEVNFLTKNAISSVGEERNLTVSCGYGGTNRYEMDIQAEGVTGSFSGVVFIDRLTEDGDFLYRLDNGTEHRRINNHESRTSSIGKVGYQSGALSTNCGVYYESSKRGVPGLISTEPTPEAASTTNRLSSSLTGRGVIGRIGWNMNAYVSDYSGRFINPGEQYNPETGRIVRYRAEDNIQNGLRYGLRTGLDIPGRTYSYRAGYSLQIDEYIGKDKLRETVTVGGVGLGDARRTVHSVDIGTAARFHHSGITWHVNPALEAQWIIDDEANGYSAISPGATLTVEKQYNIVNIGLNAGWGRSIMAPPFNAIFTVESMFAVGNQDLKPEKGESWNLGISLVSAHYSTVKWRLETSLFNHRTNNLIIWRRNSFGKYFPSNVARTKNTGVELNAQIQPFGGFISLTGSYIYNNPRNDTPGDINRGNLLPLISRHIGSLGVVSQFRELNVSLRSRWISRRYSTESNQDPISTADMALDPYSIYDFACSRTFKVFNMDITLEMAVDNLSDSSYRIVERSPMPGRTLFFKLDIGLF